MAKFDVYRSLSKDTAVAFLLDVQSNLLSDLRTRIVIPLVPLASYGTPIARLNPVVAIQGELYTLATPNLAGVHVSALGEKVTSLDNQSDEIVSAIDFLLIGF